MHFYKAHSLHKHQLQTLFLLCTGSLLAIGAALWQSYPELLNNKTNVCQIKRQNATITRAQALKLIATKEGGKRSELVMFLQEPYCQLPELQVRTVEKSKRDVYPLDSDPDIWIVLLYERDEYAGYRFLSNKKYKVQ